MWLMGRTGPGAGTAQFDPEQRLSHSRYRTRRRRSDPDSSIRAEASKRYHQFPCRKNCAVPSAVSQCCGTRPERAFERPSSLLMRRWKTSLRWNVLIQECHSSFMHLKPGDLRRFWSGPGGILPLIPVLAGSASLLPLNENPEVCE